MATDGVPFTAAGQLLLPATERLFVREKGVEIKIADTRGHTLLACGNGVAYLTDQRIIFQADKPVTFTSIALPIFYLRNPQLQQPVFGSNYVEADVLTFVGGSIPPDGAHFKLWFKEGGAVAFGSQLMRNIAVGPPPVQTAVPVQYQWAAPGGPAYGGAPPPMGYYPPQASAPPMPPYYGAGPAAGSAAGQQPPYPPANEKGGAPPPPQPGAPGPSEKDPYPPPPPYNG